MSADNNETGLAPYMGTLPWSKQSDKNLLCDNGEGIHYVIVDYGIGGEAKAYAELLKINKRLPTVTAELVQARDFTQAFKSQLHESKRNWILVHVWGTLVWYGHGMWITPQAGDIVGYHGGAGDRGWCPVQDPDTVYSSDPADPQISKWRYLKGLEEVLTYGSPLDAPKQIFVAEDSTDPQTLRLFVDRIKKLVEGCNIKVTLKPYSKLIAEPHDGWTSVAVALEKDREKHQGILQLARDKVEKERKERKNGPDKFLEGAKGDTGIIGCCGGPRG